MALYLRVDVDKPYGRHTLIRKIASKIVEDYLTKMSIGFGFLTHLNEFIEFCNDKNIPGNFFHRICTLPKETTLNLYSKGNHRIGLHLENSTNIDNFIKEIKLFQINMGYKPAMFSKHGSGNYKLGKYHYPIYEPTKYKKWSIELDIKFPSGNGTPEKAEDLLPSNNYFENLFWVEPHYRNPKFNSVDSLIQFSKYNDAVVLIHPCNFLAEPETREAFKTLVQKAFDHNIEWKLF